MRKAILIGMATLGLSMIPVNAAFADPTGPPPGQGTSSGNTVCSGHGAFGAFGTFGDVTHDFGINNPGTNDLPGASNFQHPSTSGGTTGGNNSQLCGNEATPPPFSS